MLNQNADTRTPLNTAPQNQSQTKWTARAQGDDTGIVKDPKGGSGSGAGG